MSRRDELLYGVHPVLEVLDTDPAGVLEIWLAESRAGGPGERLASRAQSVGCALHRVPRRTLERLVGKVSHQGVVCRYRVVERLVLDFDGLLARIHENTLLLVLDEVQDPRNLGACLRSAAAAGGRFWRVGSLPIAGATVDDDGRLVHGAHTGKGRFRTLFRTGAIRRLRIWPDCNITGKATAVD